MVFLFLIFWGISILFSTVAAPMYSPPMQHKGFPFSVSSPTLSIVFWIVTIMVGEKWYLTMVLICVSLVSNDTEHLLYHYWPSVCLFGKMSIPTLCSFLNSFFLMLIWVLLYINPLSDNIACKYLLLCGYFASLLRSYLVCCSPTCLFLLMLPLPEKTY